MQLYLVVVLVQGAMSYQILVPGSMPRIIEGDGNPSRKGTGLFI